MQIFDVIVVGASFAGIACAKKIARQGLSVAVLEKKKNIRDNIHTTGILVNEAANLLQLPPHLYKQISQVRLYSASKRYFEIKSSHYMFLATDMPALMEYLIQDATVQGVQFFLGTAFNNATAQQPVSVNNGSFQCRFLIGADGAQSKVAEVYQLGTNKRFLIGTEFEYEGAEADNTDAFYCFLSQRYAPGYIGWAIPGPRVMQVGIAKIYHQKKQARPDIEGFITFVQNQVRLNGAKIVEKRGGLIPIGGLVKPFYNEHSVLVGDAAGIVSPLSAGGIHTALFYGARLGELVCNYLIHKAPHPGSILEREYPRFLHKHAYRWIFNHMPDWFFNFLFCLPGFSCVAYTFFFLKKRLPGMIKSSAKTNHRNDLS